MWGHNFKGVACPSPPVLWAPVCGTWDMRVPSARAPWGESVQGVQNPACAGAERAGGMGGLWAPGAGAHGRTWGLAGATGGAACAGLSWGGAKRCAQGVCGWGQHWQGHSVHVMGTRGVPSILLAGCGPHPGELSQPNPKPCAFGQSMGREQGGVWLCHNPVHSGGRPGHGDSWAL